MNRRGRSVAWTATAGLAVVLGLVGTWVGVGISHPGAGLFHLLCGWGLAFAGLAAWRVAPDSRVGPLLAAAGIGTFLGDAAGCLDISPISRRCLDLPVLAATSRALALLWTGFLAHALLTFPTGRIDDRTTRIAVAAGYLVALALPALGAGAEVVAGLALTAWLTIRWVRSSPRARAERLAALLGAAGLALVVSVADAGHGMTADCVAMACDPFYSTKPAHVGGGLGLASVHGFVAAHHGGIAIDSAPGEGTTVRLYLPAAASPAALL